MEYTKEKIKGIRESLFLTQAEFAELLGVSFETVNRWEKGHHEPTMKAKRKINRLLNSEGSFRNKD